MPYPDVSTMNPDNYITTGDGADDSAIVQQGKELDYSNHVESYEDGYPHGIAGHRAPNGFNNQDGNIVNTKFGPDWGFSGDNMAKPDDESFEAVGTDGIDHAIGEKVHQASELASIGGHRDTARIVNFGNNVFSNVDSIRLLRRNPARRIVTVSNQGSTMCLISNQKIAAIQGLVNLTSPPPNCAFLPPNAARDIRTRGEVWIYGGIGAVVDFVEEVY